MLTTQAIPHPRLLIKDQKPVNKKGGFPTRFSILAKNCTATFYKISYLGINNMLDKVKVN